MHVHGGRFFALTRLSPRTIVGCRGIDGVSRNLTADLFPYLGKKDQNLATTDSWQRFLLDTIGDSRMENISAVADRG